MPTKIIRLSTFGMAALGVLVFHVLDLPLPFLFGPMLACLGAALLGFPLKGFGQVSVAARTILGVAVGASITPHLLSQIPTLAHSLVLIPVFLLAVGIVGLPWFYYIWKLDFATSYYSAMPGGLQDMVIFGAEAGGNTRALSLIHATRVLIIVTIAPLMLVQFYDVSLERSLGQPMFETPFVELLVMVIAAWAGWKGGERIGLFGASILGPMIVTASLSLLGIIHFRPPKEAILFAQFFIGTGVGVSFAGITLRELRNFVFAGVGYTALLWLIVLAFILWIVPASNYSAVDVFLAFAPGGQAEMAVLTLVTGADLGFVVVHHITRIVLVITCAPFVGRLMKRWAKPQG